MTSYRLPLAVAAVFAAVSIVLPAFVSTQTPARNARERVDGHDVVAGEVLVRFRAEARMPDVYRTLDVDDDRPVGRQGGWRRLHSPRRSVQALMQALTSRGDVLDVEPNYILQAVRTPNDPGFPALWGMGTSHGSHATGAWDVSTGSTSAVVGLIDSGIDYTHPDLAANIWSAPTAFTVVVGGRSLTCPAGSHGFNAITFSCDPMDDEGHGTHISGTIGATGNNALGVVGVNWTTRIMGLKFLDSTGFGTSSNALNAIDFAIQVKAAFAGTGAANIRVLSNSYGGGGYSSAFSAAIGRSAAADMLFVAAAGNGASNTDAAPFYPASYANDSIVSVTATDEADALASFSDYGITTVDLGAPGTDILSTIPGGGYGRMSGTSMATPHVAGAAALMLSACTLTTAELKAAILDNVDSISSLSGITLTGGRLDVDRAIRSCATGPSVTLTSPNDGAAFLAPGSIAISAQANDPDGVAKVEFYSNHVLIATDMSDPFAFTWTGVPVGSYSLEAIAYDTLGLATSSNAAQVEVSDGQDSQTLLTTQVPAAYFNDGAPYELGVRVVADVAGRFTAVRFWKAPAEAGPHVGRIWTAGGQLLSTVTFANETSSGWQQQALGAPVDVVAGAEYVISVSTQGYFADAQDGFAAGLTNGHLRALAGANGVFGLLGVFPTDSYRSSNYFRDVVFSGQAPIDTTPPTVSISQPVDGGTVTGSITLEAHATDDTSVAGVQFQIDGVAFGGEDATTPYTAVWDTALASAGVHLVTAVARDAAGHVASASITVTVVHESSTSQTLLTTQVPAAYFNDGVPYELGVRVVADVAGRFTAVRFWKAPQEAGTHVGSIWTAGGQLLSTVTFANETSSGWQQQALGIPVDVVAGAEYVISVSTQGYFADTQDAFAAGLTNGHLRALAGANGVFGPSGVFPADSYRSSNYFRDIVFVSGQGPIDTMPPTVSISQPVDGRTVTGSITLEANATDDTSVAGVQFQIDGVAFGGEDATTPYTAVWDTALASAGVHLVTAVARDAAGHVASASITVTVVHESSTSQTLLTTQVPAAYFNDGVPYELGVRVVADVAGRFTAVRFWKAPQEAGTHVGSIWTAAGQLLATVAFANETSSGWQEQMLDVPVNVVAGVEYVVSVTAPNYFADTQQSFDAGLTNGHLRAPSGLNGVFGPVGARPTESYQSSNYFRDVVFVVP